MTINKEFKIKGQCPKCNGVYQAPEEWIGKEAECPFCKADIIIQTVENTSQTAYSQTQTSLLLDSYLTHVGNATQTAASQTADNTSQTADNASQTADNASQTADNKQSKQAEAKETRNILIALSVVIAVFVAIIFAALMSNSSEQEQNASRVLKEQQAKEQQVMGALLLLAAAKHQQQLQEQSRPRAVCPRCGGTGRGRGFDGNCTECWGKGTIVLGRGN